MSSHGEEGNVRVVIAALIGNLLIAVAKFVAAFLSGSLATLAEAVHSVADTTNQVLLLVGMRRARAPATSLHPFGHTLESYFWPFIVSMLIFLLGGAFALYEGVHGLIDVFTGTPHGDPGSRLSSYVVLGLSFLFEGYSCSIAFAEFQKARGDRTIREALFHGKDPTIPIVLAEDSAALVGLAIALVAVGLADLTGWHGFDAIGSTLIGLLLGTIAFFLASRTHSLLLGESITKEERDAITELAPSVEGVVRVTQLLSMHLGPNDAVLALKIELDRGLDTAKVEAAIDRLEAKIRERFPAMHYIFVEPDGRYAAGLDPNRPIELDERG